MNGKFKKYLFALTLFVFVMVTLVVTNNKKSNYSVEDSSKEGKITLVAEYNDHTAKFVVTVGNVEDVVNVPSTGKSYIFGIIGGIFVLISGILMIRYAKKAE